ncbi:diacylglycerol acyltransferase family protein [Rhizoclosmatium globosum]|uniref:Diacylglycerol O-acyltransferase n=1 Tax=Rhizoclosmatium globosum TaxID=329046 RepID=A0A1Y2CL19_9FUNG|nr:diacylglycerol acyltransferase family protein [Rhizoclosmatium globosum]|eukprot:ORY47015.1 diacylglycerol acyltransferase family protein [Rhizoclosmatium globosum]
MSVRQPNQTVAQLCAIAIWLFFPFLCPFVALLMLWHSNITRAIIIPMILYSIMDRSHLKGGRPSHLFRSLSIWHTTASYFPIQLHKTSDLPSGTPYIFGFHPHGILAISHFMTFGTEALGLSKLYPDLGMVHTTTLASNFSVPIVKDYFMAVGMISVDKEALQYVLRRGESVVIVVGGAREAMDARPGTNVLSLQKRFGFVKIALQTGAPLVPVFAFGENDIWDQVDNGMGTYVRSFQELVKKIFGFSPVLVYGRFGILPYRRDINVVIGKPMIVPKIQNPTHEDIQKYHALYLQELQTLYDSRKDEFLPNRKEELIIA